VKTNDEVDKLVFKYLEEHRGEMSLSRASQELGILQVDLTQSISRLQRHRLIQREFPPIERMRVCASCKKTIGEGESFCSYCGAKQAIVHAEPQALLDPLTMKAALAILSKVTGAKDHPDYSSIDQLTTMIGDVALGTEKPHDASELSFSDQLRLLALVFEFTRDKVGYKGEAFGEHIRWPWETVTRFCFIWFKNRQSAYRSMGNLREDLRRGRGDQ
jgi:hypothetical protein